MATHADTHLARTIGSNIARGREAKGITQQQLATELATSTSRVSGWERGIHLPARRQHARLAAVLFEGDEGALFKSDKEAA